MKTMEWEGVPPVITIAHQKFLENRAKFVWHNILKCPPHRQVAMTLRMMSSIAHRTSFLGRRPEGDDVLERRPIYTKCSYEYKS